MPLDPTEAARRAGLLDSARGILETIDWDDGPQTCAHPAACLACSDACVCRIGGRFMFSWKKDQNVCVITDQADCKHGRLCRYRYSYGTHEVSCALHSYQTTPPIHVTVGPV